MKTLLDGYKRFRENVWRGQRNHFEVLARDGQAPDSLVVTCVDSRVDPAMIFDAAPGEMLTVRNVANIVPPYAPDSTYHGTSAALEFGVRVLEVKHVIVLGHGLCGGVKTLLADASDTGHEFIGPWMSIARPARAVALRAGTEEERQLRCEHELIKISLANLMTFPWVDARVASGKLKLHGAWFDIQDGVLMILQPDGSFVAA
jgi:carbonic anhydrase